MASDGPGDSLGDAPSVGKETAVGGKAVASDGPGDSPGDAPSVGREKVVASDGVGEVTEYASPHWLGEVFSVQWRQWYHPTRGGCG